MTVPAIDTDAWANPPQPRRTSFSAPELLGMTFPEPRFAVPGLLAEGLNLLVSPPKIGKSWLMLATSVAVASGGRALGRVPVVSGDALFLGLEDSPRRLQSRLRTILGTDDAPPALTLSTECLPLAEGGCDQIDKWLSAHSDARLVTVDVFAKVRGPIGDRASRYESDYAAMSLLKDVADAHGVALVAVHHTRKQDADDFLDTVSGSQGLAGAADAVLVLRRSRGSSDATLRITGRDVEETDYALDFDAHIGTWTLLDGPALDYELGETRRRILQYLRDVGAATPKQLADALSIEHETAKKTVRRMADDGQLDTDGSGSYFPPAVPCPPGPSVPVLEGHGDAGDTLLRGTA